MTLIRIDLTKGIIRRYRNGRLYYKSDGGG